MNGTKNEHLQAAKRLIELKYSRIARAEDPERQSDFGGFWQCQDHEEQQQFKIRKIYRNSF